MTNKEKVAEIKRAYELIGNSGLFQGLALTYLFEEIDRLQEEIDRLVMMGGTVKKKPFLATPLEIDNRCGYCGGFGGWYNGEEPMMCEMCEGTGQLNLSRTVKVLWTPAFQSYYSAGDEAEPYCEKCEFELEDNFKYCPICGSKLDWGDVN